MPSCNETNPNVSLHDLIPEVKTFIPGVADPIVVSALLRAAMQVADKAKLLKETVVLDYFCGVSGYPVESKKCTTLVNIRNVRINNCSVNFSIPEYGWIEIDESESERPSKRRGLEVDVFAGVSRTDCRIPTEMYERYGHVIINMTLARLYGMFAEDWYSPENSRLYGGLGAGGIADAKGDSFEQEFSGGIPIGNGGLLV